MQRELNPIESTPYSVVFATARPRAGTHGRRGLVLLLLALGIARPGFAVNLAYELTGTIRMGDVSDPEVTVQPFVCDGGVHDGIACATGAPPGIQCPASLCAGGPQDGGVCGAASDCRPRVCNFGENSGQVCAANSDCLGALLGPRCLIPPNAIAGACDSGPYSLPECSGPQCDLCFSDSDCRRPRCVALPASVVTACVPAVCQGGLNAGSACLGKANCPDCPPGLQTACAGGVRGEGACVATPICVGGTNNGMACTGNSNCPPAGNSCVTTSRCRGGANNGLACVGDADCPDCCPSAANRVGACPAIPAEDAPVCITHPSEGAVCVMPPENHCHGGPRNRQLCTPCEQGGGTCRQRRACMGIFADSEGEPFRALLVYDTSARDAAPANPTLGSYPSQPQAPSGLSFTLNSARLSVADWGVSTEIVNGASDSLTLVNPSPPAGRQIATTGLDPTSLGLVLLDSSGTVFNSIALPPDLDLADFDVAEITLTKSVANPANANAPFVCTVVATIETLTPVTAPEESCLLPSAAAGTAFTRSPQSEPPKTPTCTDCRGQCSAIRGACYSASNAAASCNERVAAKLAAADRQGCNDAFDRAACIQGVNDSLAAFNAAIRADRQEAHEACALAASVCEAGYRTPIQPPLDRTELPVLPEDFPIDACTPANFPPTP